MSTEAGIADVLRINYPFPIDEVLFHRDGGSLSYIVLSKGKKYFLRLVRSEFMDTAIQSVDIHVYLCRHGFPVPRMMDTKEGAPYFTADGEGGKQLYILYEYLDGQEPDIHKDAEAIGSLVGRFHHIMQDYQGPLTTRKKSYFIDRYIEILRKKQYPDDKLSRFIEYGESLWDKVKNLPYGYCHGDLNRGNLHQTPTGDIYLLDFDTSCQAFPVYDIMMVCNCTDYFAFTESGFHETTRIYERFLTGYLQHRTLSDSELSAFYDLVAVMHYQLQATMIEIYGLDCVDEAFIDSQLDWLMKWRAVQQAWSVERLA